MLFHTLRSAGFVLRGMFAMPALPSAVSGATCRMWIGFRTYDLFFHVNNARYLELFEFARWELGARAGMPRLMAKTGAYPVVASAHVQYFRPLKCWKWVDVETEIVGVHAKKNLIMAQRVVSTKPSMKTGERTVFAAAVFKATFMYKGKPCDAETVFKMWDVPAADRAALLTNDVSLSDDSFAAALAARGKDAATVDARTQYLRLINKSDGLWRSTGRHARSSKPAASRDA